MTVSKAARSFWLIGKYDNGWIDVLTVDSTGSVETLPVFSFQEEAEAFLWLSEMSDIGWLVREITAGELVSVLNSLLKGVKKVTLDPLPVACGGTMLDLVGWSKERFIRSLVGYIGLWLSVEACSKQSRPRVPILWEA